MTLTLFSGGAAQAVVQALQTGFETANACTLKASFGAVGAMRDKLLSGEPCDLVILSASLVNDLDREGRVAGGKPLGSVATGIAVRAGTPPPPMRNVEELKSMLTAAQGFYVADLRQSSGGIHIAAVLDALGIREALNSRIHEYPNGATALRELARTTGAGLVGCSQVTEILYTEGTTLVGELPPGHELNTVYVAAVCTDAAKPELAHRFLEALSGESSRGLRSRAGFKL
jgi:molybdate transport system substrate-binding protein